jgi:hypothetical protein
MARWAEAAWRPVKNHGGARPSGQPSVVVLHHAVMNGSLFSVFNGSRQASTDFWIAKDGRAEQYVDTAMTSWGNGNANANQRGIAVETEGCASPPHAEPMTDAMVNTFARLLAWANRTHGIPLRTTDDYNVPGFGYHRMRGGPATGCPCDVRLRMRPEILRRAQGGAPAPPPPTPPEDEEMIASGVAPTGVLHTFVARSDAVFVTWYGGKEWSGKGRGGGYPAGVSHFAAAPKGQKIVGITCVNYGNLFWLFCRTEDGASWATWQSPTTNSWSGGGGGWAAGFSHFAAKP